MNTPLEYRLRELLDVNQSPPQYSPKIQRVAYVLRNRKECEKHYSPQFVSMGPIHHGRPYLELGENYKQKWAAKYIEKTAEVGRIKMDDMKGLYKVIEDNIDELKGLFADDVLSCVSWEGFNSFEEKLSWMLFVDGCSLLHIIENRGVYEEVEIFKVDKLFLVCGDAFLLENQLPYRLLKLLWKNNKSDLIQKMDDFVWHFWRTAFHNSLAQEHGSNIEPIHLLDRLHITLVPGSKSVPNYLFDESAGAHHFSYEELKAKGIRVELNDKGKIRNISFSQGWLHGELKLPEIILDDNTISIFLNLIAYEMCPDFINNYGICTFFAFMDSIIRQPEDVKDLRSKRILLCNLGSDEKVVKLFHFLAADVIPNSEIYLGVRIEIFKHIINRLKTNFRRFLTYIRHPWTNIVVHAAELGLALAFVQTWFTAHPPK